mgnify:CR=1 FL=1
MHTISIFVDQNRMPKLASYFECQTHLAKNLRNSANFILRNLRTGLKKDPVDRTSNENEVIETVRIGIEMANEKLLKDVESACRRPGPHKDPKANRKQTEKPSSHANVRSLDAHI